MKKIITPPFRASFVYLAKPQEKEGQESKYRMTIVLQKSNEFWKTLAVEIHNIVDEKFGKNARYKNPILDGNDMCERYHNFKNCYYCTASNTIKPEVVDANNDYINGEEKQIAELYSGAWYRAQIHPYIYGGKNGILAGVSIALDNVQKIKDAKAYGNDREDAVSVFTPFTDFKSLVDDDDDDF